MALQGVTVALVTEIALVDVRNTGRADLYVADRKPARRLRRRTSRCGPMGSLHRNGTTDVDGMASLALNGAAAQPGNAPDNVWVIARSGADTAIVTPWSYSLGLGQRSELGTPTLHRQTRLSARSHVHIRGMCAPDRTMHCHCRRTRRSP